MAGSGAFRVAVVTPYFRENPEVLEKCHSSVADQTYPCTHFLVADGNPHACAAGWAVEHLILPRSHCDNGNTPRSIGSLSAMNQGYDAISFLDADNWYYPNHVEAMVALYRLTNAAVCTTSRTIHRLDGSLMYADTKECDGRSFVDTSCLFIMRAAYGLLPIWAMMPRQLAPICDRMFWRAIKSRRYACAHCTQPTVAFRTQYQSHYQNCGEQPPLGTKSDSESTDAAFNWWNSLPRRQRKKWERYFDSA